MLTDKYILISKSIQRNAAFLYKAVDLKIRVLLMSALILYCSTSMLHVLHSHTPDLIDIIVPVSHLTGRCRLHVGYLRHKAAFSTYLDHGWHLVRRSLGRFHPNFVQNCFFCFFIQNAKFRDFVRFSSKTNFLCPSNGWPHNVLWY